MEELPEEIIDEILTRLSVDSLVRFKYVSKQWLGYVSDPRFVRFHLNQTKAKNGLKIMFMNIFGSLYSLDNMWAHDHVVSFEDPFKNSCITARILGSCDGLVLMCQNSGEMVLWNPSTRQCKKLSGGDAYNGNYITLHGLGYVKSTEDYKVVTHTFINNRSEVYTYTLGNNSWRKINANTIPCLRFGSRHSGVFVNGILYWIVRRSNYHEIIISFDLEDEYFRELSLPDYDGDGNHMAATWELGDLGGRLCVLECYYSSVTRNFFIPSVYVCVTKDPCISEPWTKYFQIRFHMIDGGLYQLKLLHALKDGQILLLINSEDLFTYDMKQKKFERVRVDDIQDVWQMDSYIESLVPLWD